MNEGDGYPEWIRRGGNSSKETLVTTVVFDKSFSKARPTSTFGWFYHMEKLTDIVGFDNLCTDSVRQMDCMFASCSSLTSIDMSSLNTTNAIDMTRMFDGCSKLQTIVFGNFNTANVQQMGSMFMECTNLKNIDLSSFNTSKVRDFSYMFYKCESLTSLDISGFDMSDARHSGIYDGMMNMFLNCSKLAVLNVGSNDFQKEGTGSVFNKVGSEASPCILITSDNFDKSVLGDKISNSNNGYYYKWLVGYFTEPVSTKIETFDFDTDVREKSTYNLSGQRVGKDYKGVVIKKGHKYINK